MKNKRGSFKGLTTGYLIKSIRALYPKSVTTYDKLSKDIGISRTTLRKVVNQTENTKLSIVSLKKITKYSNKFQAKEQIKLAKITSHLKRYKTISDKAVKKIIKEVNKRSKEIAKMTKKEKQYLYYRELY